MPMEVVVELQIRAVRESDESPLLAPKSDSFPRFLNGTTSFSPPCHLTTQTSLSFGTNRTSVPKIFTLVFPDFLAFNSAQLLPTFSSH